MIVNFVLILTTLFLFCGLAIDAGFMQLQKQKMQTAADAAALGAAYESSLAKTDWVTAGRADAAANGFTNGSNGVTVTIVTPPTSGAYTSDSSAFQASVSRAVPTIFMGFLGVHSATINTRAVATKGPGAACAYTLDSTKSRSLQMSGSSASIGCGTFVDSNASGAVELEGSATLTSNVNVVGTVQNNGGTISGTVKTGVATETDPLASTPQPAFSSCTYTGSALNITTSKTLNPGTYCGNLTISNQAHVTLTAGTYMITGGINWNDQSVITGAGVTLFFTTGGGYTYTGSGVVISGDVTVNLSAPTSGSTAGIVMFGDRTLTDTNQVVNFNGGSNVTLNGILYFPEDGVIFSDATVTSTTYLGIVSDNLTVNGGSTLNIPDPNYSSLSGGSPFKSGVALTE